MLLQQMLGVVSRAEQQVLRRHVRQQQLQTAGLLHACQSALHEIFPAKGTENKASQGGAALLQRLGGQAVVVHRQVDQKAVLRVMKGLLQQDHTPRHGGQTGVARTLHGFAPQRLAEHIKAHSTLVAPFQGLDVDNRHHGVAWAGWMHRILGQPLSAHLPLVLRQLARTQHRRKSQPLHTRVRAF